MDLHHNLKETKSLVASHINNFIFYGEEIEIADTFSLQGSTIDTQAASSQEIQR